MSDRSDAALAYATRGWHIFPVHSLNGGRCTCGKADCTSPGKHPRTGHGLQDASRDAATITAWWERWPDANIAVNCGASGLVVVDVDTKAGCDGGETWAELVAAHSAALEHSVMAETPSGGWHVFFAANGHRVASGNDKLGPGVDIKAEGGYVVLPPAEGRDWVPGKELGARPIASLPAALGAVLDFSPDAARADCKRAAAPAHGKPIAEGKRNETLASLAGSMRRRDMSPEAIRAALRQENQSRCRPPLSEREVDAIAASVARYESSERAEHDEPFSSPGRRATVQPEPVPEAPPAIAGSPDILAALATALHARGVVGEDRFVKVTYLCLTSRVLERPVSLVAKGPSAAGKSFVVQQVVEFMPSSAYFALSAMSERALAYSQEPLEHRFLILYEAAGMEGEFATYLLRSLLSEGCIRYETVEKVKGGGLQPRLIERRGPTGLVVTTTQVQLHPENETRLLSVPANDTAAQTAAIIRALAAEDRRQPQDCTEWRALQSWIGAQDNGVTIPFAAALAELVPPVAVRLRRDFATVLNLIKAHAILHQRTRDHDTEGRIIATVGDYGAVRDLVGDLVADEVGATVPAATVETVNAVAELASQASAGVTYQQLGARLQLDKSTAMRRARVALNRGYLKNLEDRRGQPARLVLGEPLPSEVTILPTVETLSKAGCTVARTREAEIPQRPAEASP